MRSRNQGNFNQNHGVPGVVYILRNEAFKENWLKIGQSRHSGHVRASDMNRGASTGLPAHHICVFEYKTLDCGRAELAVFQALHSYRKGRQEFFECDIGIAKNAIRQVCVAIDAPILAAQKQLQQQQDEERHARDRQEERAQLAEREARFAVQRNRQRVEAAEYSLARDKALPRIDITCPECNMDLVARCNTEDIQQKIRCPRCKCIFKRSVPVLRAVEQVQPKRLEDAMFMQSDSPTPIHSISQIRAEKTLRWLDITVLLATVAIIVLIVYLSSF